MKTLGELASKYNATISKSDEGLTIRKLHPEGLSNMYFSGYVVRHIDVNVEGLGLNKTGAWPFYLVNDEGKMKILSAR